MVCWQLELKKNIYFYERTYPASGNRKWVCSVQAFLPIVNWQTVTKNGHLEMFDHRVHHLPAESIRRRKYTIIKNNEAPFGNSWIVR